jgi:hypothetical protein
VIDVALTRAPQHEIDRVSNALLHFGENGEPPTHEHLLELVESPAGQDLMEGGWDTHISELMTKYPEPPAVVPPPPAAVVVPPAPPPAEAPAPAPTPEAPVSPTPQPPAAIVSLLSFVDASVERREDWETKKQEAYTGLNDALASRKIRIRRDAEYLDQDANNGRGYVCSAFHYLHMQVAKGQMTADQAAEYALSQMGWTEELRVDPRVMRSVFDALKAESMFLHRTAKVIDHEGKEIEVDVHEQVGQAVEAGLPLDKAIAAAIRAGWAVPFNKGNNGSDDETIGAEKAEEMRAARRR